MGKKLKKREFLIIDVTPHRETKRALEALAMKHSKKIGQRLSTGRFILNILRKEVERLTA